MKRLPLLISLFLFACCSRSADPYSGFLHELMVSGEYPAGYDYDPASAVVTVEDVNRGDVYSKSPSADGAVRFRLPVGLYRVSCRNVGADDIFNGTCDKVKLASALALSVPLAHSRAGRIVFKEIYCGGCMKYPEQGTYQSDQYVILHNNYPGVQYLDGLCFGTLAPYNSNASNPFITDGNLPDFLPIIQAVWQFGGDGDDFPLQSGEDAVLCLRGAIDHSAQYPLSVNLDRPGYFVCYNETYFTNPQYHPAPGPNISRERILDVVVKTGQANAYTFSVSSPAAVIFRAPEGTTMKEYVQQEGSIVQIPGSSVDRVVKIPPEWVVDAVEVFNGSSTSNLKRLPSSVDAGYVALSGTFLGHTLFRLADEQMSSSLGYEVLSDTNNSSEDFYEREEQSLK